MGDDWWLVVFVVGWSAFVYGAFRFIEGFMLDVIRDDMERKKQADAYYKRELAKMHIDVKVDDDRSKEKAP